MYVAILYITPNKAKNAIITAIISNMLARDFMNRTDFIKTKKIEIMQRFVNKSQRRKNKDTAAIISIIPSKNATIKIKTRYLFLKVANDRTNARRVYKLKDNF